MAPPWLLALGLVVAFLVLIPARRLRGAGLSSTAVGLYALAIWALAMLVAITAGGTRLLIPVLLAGYLAPFIASPDVIGRVLRRRPPRRPMKDVTPPDPPELPRGPD